MQKIPRRRRRLFAKKQAGLAITIIATPDQVTRLFRKRSRRPNRKNDATAAIINSRAPG